MVTQWISRLLNALLAVNTCFAARVQLPTVSELSTKRNPYDFSQSERWITAGFEEKWGMFRAAVPLDVFQSQYDPDVDQGPVCQPGLYGPRESDKLAILQHGFLSCPGTWYRVVPRLVAEGFRVMLPVLPGHGRKYIQANGTIIDLGAAMDGDGNTTPSEDGMVKDDLSDMPVASEDFLIFAKSLGQLAAQFKKDHPGGIVVVAGHSMGGAVTIQYAQEYADYIDRVIVLNPFLGLASVMANIALALAPTKRLSKGKTCENNREVSSGGACQFRLTHVSAMAKFARNLLCNHFSIPRDCGMPRNNKLADVKDFQVLSSSDESLVDNGKISEFVQAVQEERALKPHGGASKDKASFCLWPKELGHSYLSNRPIEKGGSEEKWWHPYVEGAVVDFLKFGKSVDVVRVGGSGNHCLDQADNVERERLTLLPAIHHRDSYSIGYRDPNDGKSVAFDMSVVFSGGASKESHHLGKMQTRHVEIVEARGLVLLVTRLQENDNIRNIYLTRGKTRLVKVVEYKGGELCSRPELLDLMEIDRPLGEILQKVEDGLDIGLKPLELKFCGRYFVNSLCNSLVCKGSPKLESPETTARGSVLWMR